MAAMGLLENPKKKLSFKQSCVMILIGGVLVPGGLMYLYNFHWEGLAIFFGVLILLFIVIGTFCRVFFGKK